jgi:flavoprotein
MIKEYIVTVEHDKGTIRIRTSGSTIEDAKNKIMNYEGCPEGAIISIYPYDPCGGRSCDECEVGGCDHGI